jgi:hypothetical protein
MHKVGIGEHAGALAHFEQADAVFTLILQRRHDAIGVLDARAALALPWARALFAGGHRSAARDTIRRTVAQLERDSVRLDSTLLTRRLCLTTCDGLRVLLDAQDNTGAELLARAPIAARRLAARSGGHVKDQELVMVTLFKTIWAHIERGADAAAVEVFAQAAAQLQTYREIGAAVIDREPIGLEHLLLGAWLESAVGTGGAVDPVAAAGFLDEARRRAAATGSILPAWSGDLLLVTGQVELSRGRTPELGTAIRIAEAWLAQHATAVPMSHRRWMLHTLARLKRGAQGGR